MARPQAELLEPARYSFMTRIPTRWGDTDPNGHINNVALARLFEEARVRYFSSDGIRLELGTLRMMVASVHIDYLAESHYPEPIDLHLGTISVGRSSWVVAELAVFQGRPCAFARAVSVCIGDSRPTPWPTALRDRLASTLLDLG